MSLQRPFPGFDLGVPLLSRCFRAPKAGTVCKGLPVLQRVELYCAWSSRKAVRPCYATEAPCAKALPAMSSSLITMV